MENHMKHLNEESDGVVVNVEHFNYKIVFQHAMAPNLIQTRYFYTEKKDN